MDAVTAVLCAAFDEATDAQVLAVRDVVREAGVELPDLPPHRPHLSMVAARVGVGDELDRLLEVAVEVAAQHQPFELTLSEVGRFGRAGALWLGPASSPALNALHRDCVSAVAAAGWGSAFGDRSEPGTWIAHCTLATRLPKPQLRQVQKRVAANYRPITGRVDAIATILVGGHGDTGHAPLRSR